MSVDVPGSRGVRPAPGVFCGACGVRLEGVRFCTSCGQDSFMAAAGAAWPASAASVAGAPLAGRSHTRVVVTVIAVTVVLVLVGGAGLTLALRGRLEATRKPEEIFRRDVTAALAPVSAATSTLAAQVTDLRTRTQPSGLRGSLRATIRAVRAAQLALAALQPSTDPDRTLLADARAALDAELAWLTVARGGLSHPDNGQVSQLSGLELEAKSRLATLAADAALPAPVFPRSAPLVRYVTLRKKAAQTTDAVTEFSSSVQALLVQSEPAYHQINELFSQLSAAARGEYVDMTVAQAEQSISTIVANRTSLAAAARALNAPTAQARVVRTALVDAMDRSLADDQAIDNCLNEANAGSVAFIFTGCLTSTATFAGAAHEAKSHFWDTYNQLRRTIGAPTAQTPF